MGHISIFFCLSTILYSFIVRLRELNALIHKTCKAFLIKNLYFRCVMKKVIRVIAFILCVSIGLSITPSVYGQNKPVYKEKYRAGELLVRAQKSALSNVLSEIDPSGAIEISQDVSAPLNIWLIKFDPDQFNEYVLLEKLQLDNRIETAQLNHLVTLRGTLPNDTDINDQWQYVNTGSNGGVVDADIDMDDAWDITTGGLTALGDTIVVCAIDDGIDLNHTDFEDNLWVNHGEIPNNNIDDDNNGYIDDYQGWNISSLDDDIAGGSHGTPVAGIMGAKGDNNRGVSGISWNVKVMVVKNDFDTDEADVIAAYTYPLVMRRMYNASSGAEGAFVVTTNASWGIDQGQPSSSPLWCAFYDTLGAAGILNCGATANWNYNIDVDGDLPTACPSDYLIAVTNMDRTDTKVQFAGYGLTTIDLGAFGDDTYTTDLGNSYGGFGGTSGATPHVAGTVGLLYSLNCPDFASLAQSNPGGAALMVKESILNGVDLNSSLSNITVTGGRLNVYNSLQFLLAACDSTVCTTPFAVSSSDVTETTAKLKWNSLSDSNYVLRFKSTSEVDWTEVNLNDAFYDLTNLKPCQIYEFQVQNTCDTGASAYTPVKTFRTEGCGSCTDFMYCSSEGSTSSSLHIQQVELNTLDNTSGDDDGYGDNLSAATSLVENQSYSMTVTPGYNGFSYNAHTYVWIDFNQNGSFSSADELVLSTDDSQSGAVTGTFTVPSDLPLGITRMRVMLKYQSQPNSACDILGLGEVEDYCIDIQENTGVLDAKNGNEWVHIYPNPFKNNFRLDLDIRGSLNEPVRITMEDLAGRIIYVQEFKDQNIQIELPENLSKGVYFVKVNTAQRSFTGKVLKD